MRACAPTGVWSAINRSALLTTLRTERFSGTGSGKLDARSHTSAKMHLKDNRIRLSNVLSRWIFRSSLRRRATMKVSGDWSKEPSLPLWSNYGLRRRHVLEPGPSCGVTRWNPMQSLSTSTPPPITSAMGAGPGTQALPDGCNVPGSRAFLAHSVTDRLYISIPASRTAGQASR